MAKFKKNVQEDTRSLQNGWHFCGTIRADKVEYPAEGRPFVPANSQYIHVLHYNDLHFNQLNFDKMESAES